MTYNAFYHYYKDEFDALKRMTEEELKSTIDSVEDELFNRPYLNAHNPLLVYMTDNLKCSMCYEDKRFENVFIHGIDASTLERRVLKLLAVYVGHLVRMGQEKEVLEFKSVEEAFMFLRNL